MKSDISFIICLSVAFICALPLIVVLYAYVIAEIKDMFGKHDEE